MMGMEPASGVTCGASVSYAVTREGETQSKCSRGLSDQLVSLFHKFHKFYNDKQQLDSSAFANYRERSLFTLMQETFVRKTNNDPFVIIVGCIINIHYYGKFAILLADMNCFGGFFSCCSKLCVSFICLMFAMSQEKTDAHSNYCWLCLLQGLCMPGAWAPTCSLAQERRTMSGAP